MTWLKKKWAGLLLLWIFVLAAWQTGALLYGPEVIPGPVETVKGGVELFKDGSLPKYIGISFYRVFSGWALGSLIAIPLGVLIGKVDVIRHFAEPLLNFIRFIPPIAFITLFLVWFGIGEQSKIALILYATLFIVMMNTLTGVLSVEEDKVRAARSMGASEWQIILHVIIPATAPYMFTGVRLAMGTSYMAIVGAEMIASNEGVGYLIWNSRLFFRTDWIFVGLISLGLMGFVTDRLFGWFGRKVLWRYGVVGSTPVRR
ncbi:MULTISPECIES: ABC transporter permease [Paenibacillus]|uniref:ABC transporter inner membrane protein n=1 Tax=Paenibacillus vini TaxID=1476024 RepID=A0ABQ4MFU8_9BACL|nr:MULTISPECIES: ABC transporter permease [Paenibacillus]MBQ4899441.1 ABC transporter permease [Paenibacillus sp. Marseille-P2973]MDN4068504.1 ABC transporter permease [Paenibacillus vini]GIP54872.1 ABC transporter inner membrane protein [Paenibacillus vini]